MALLKKVFMRTKKKSAKGALKDEPECFVQLNGKQVCVKHGKHYVQVFIFFFNGFSRDGVSRLGLSFMLRIFIENRLKWKTKSFDVINDRSKTR